MHKFRRLGIALATAGLIVGVIGPLPVAAEIGLHGLTLSKGCDSPTEIGDPYTCSYVIGNFIIPGGDSVGDDLTVTSLVDTINKPGSPSSGNILADPAIAPFVGFVDNGGGLPSCVGLGTPGVVCTLPGAGAAGTLGQGSAITITDYSFYTVVAADFTVDPVNHLLTDTVAATWQDLCNGSTPGTPTNCPVGNQTATSGSSTVVQQLSSSTATEIHDAAHAVVTAVVVGTNVHDRVIVTGQPGKDTPTGNVNIDWFLNNSCSGAAAVNSGPIALGADGTVDATAFNFTVNTAGGRSFQAHYEGDATYTGSTGACEPLTVVNARISITPDATNQVGQPHTFTVLVEENRGDGAGFVPADGESVTVTLTDSNGAANVPSTPLSGTTDAAGEFQVTFTSATPGTVTGHASSNVDVLGLSVPRETDGTGGNTGDAVKRFVDANIQITPDGVNTVNESHTFTATVNVNDGTGSAPAPDGTVVTFTIDSGPGSFVGGVNTCNTTGGSCTVDITSAVTGVTVVSASATVDANGVPIMVTTNGVAPNSDPAEKTFVNARISITPDATNAVGDPHTFTVLVEEDQGDGAGFVPADGESVTVTLANSNGAVADPAGPFNGTTDAAGEFEVTFTSATPGTVTGHASSNVDVLGEIVAVQTDGTGGSTGDAVKRFVDANIQITPDGVNTVNESHTFTATVNVNTGAGPGPAPDGTVVTFTIDSGPGSFDGPDTCNTTGGSCTVDITSAVTGVTVVSASANVTVGGVPVTVSTDGNAPNSGPAEKTFVNARISITPDATNAVGDPHTFTVLVEEDAGDGAGFVPADGESVTVTLANSNGAVADPAGPFNGTTDAAGEFQVTFTSATTGTVTGHASSNVDVLGEIVAVQTDGVAPNGDDAVKRFVNANIQINPPTATNPVNTNHVLTITVNALNGTLGDGNATASIESGPGSFVGSPTCAYTGGGASASCTVTITSAVAGTTVISATSDIPVSGVTITRTTETAVNTAAGGSDNAEKIWESPPVGQITPTNVDCQQYASGTAPTLATIFYRNGGNPSVIHQSINPGVFFYFSTITVAAGDVAQTSQSTTNSSGALFLLNQGHAQVYTADCVKIGDMTPNNGGATGTFTFATAGTYILRLQYQTKSIAGTPAPNPDNPTYTFDVAVNGVEVVPNTVSITLTKT